MEKDHLMEINKTDLPLLRSLYTPNSVRNKIACMVIDNYMRYFQLNPNLEGVQFFCLNGDFSDGTFVVIDGDIIYAETISDSFENLSRLVKLIDYSKGRYSIVNIADELEHIFKDALKEVNVGVSVDDQFLVYTLPREDALKLDARSEDVELRPLSEFEHKQKAFRSFWADRFPTLYPFFERITIYNQSVGAFKKDGTLVAWCLIVPHGQISSLKTDEGFLGRGYGSLLVRHLSKMHAELGYDCFALISENNAPSISLFKKLGYKSVGGVHVIQPCPNNTKCHSTD